MQSLESELARARGLDVSALAAAIESVGFECTRCGACCTAEGEEDHTATVFPDEARTLAASTDREWRDVARPMPYGLRETDGQLEGETFEWALQTNACGDCTFYTEDEAGVGACRAHADRPLICQTYPFSVGLAGTSQPMGEAVDSVALPAQREVGDEADSDEGGSNEGDGDGGDFVRVHECEGLGRDISRTDAEALARALKTRAIRELEEAIAVRDGYEPADPSPGEIVVHDSEGAKRADGTPLQRQE